MVTSQEFYTEKHSKHSCRRFGVELPSVLGARESDLKPIPRRTYPHSRFESTSPDQSAPLDSRVFPTTIRFLSERLDMAQTKPTTVNSKGNQYRLIPKCPLKDLKPYDRNPRKNDLAVNEVARSIELFGFVAPIIANEKMIICAGHTRYKAALQLGMKTVPVIVVNGLRGNNFKAYNIADNKTAELAGWDTPELGNILAELKADSFDLGSLGFSDAELNEIMAQLDTNPVSNGLGAVPSGNAYSEQFGVIVICENEDHQAETYNRLTKQGMNCKVVTT